MGRLARWSLARTHPDHFHEEDSFKFLPNGLLATALGKIVVPNIRNRYVWHKWIGTSVHM